MRRNRRFSAAEFLIYLSGWGLVFFVARMGTRTAFAEAVFFLVPGILAFGPVGLTLGGRQWFWPAALIGTVLWLVVVPTMNASR